MRPRIINIILYILIKYFIFYIILAIKNENYAVFQMNNIKSYEDFLFYLFLFLSLPTISIVLFSVPFFYIFKIRKTLLFFILLLIVFVIEYFIYTYLASETDFFNGIYLTSVGIILFFVFYFKAIKSIISSNETN